MNDPAAVESGSSGSRRIWIVGLLTLALLTALIGLEPTWNARLQLFWFDAFQRHLPRKVETTPAMVVEIDEKLPAFERRKKTLAAMIDGCDVVYQAALFDGCWGGYADFLVRTPRTSRLGNYSYEAIDTKLALRPEVAHLIQLSIYSDALTTMQGVEPDRM